MTTLPREIFKAYDIRGVVGRTLTPDIVRAVGHALGSLARERGGDTFAIGRDGRLSGPMLLSALADGIRAAGVDVIDLGLVATPMTYFAAHHLGTGSAVMVTGSHNPPDYNGLKMVVAGDTLSGDDIQALRARIEGGPLLHGHGGYRTVDIGPAYLDRIVADVKVARPLKIVVDCGNGVAGAFAPTLYTRMGCTVVPLFCDVDGHFPNHHPGPLAARQSARPDRAAGDRRLRPGTGVRRRRRPPWRGHARRPHHLPGPPADAVCRRRPRAQPGATVIYDVKSTRNLKPWITRHGGVPLLWKTGHSLIKGKMKEIHAALAGEMSGHTFFGERWYGFDDGLYAGARLLEILSRHADPSAVLDALPDALSTPELNVPCAEGEPHALIAKMAATETFPGSSEVIRIDGLRVEYADGFGLARASNTTPVIVLRFEADNAAALARIQDEFRHVLERAKPGVALPF